MGLRSFQAKTMPRSKQYPDRHVVLQRWVTFGLQYPALPFSFVMSKMRISPNGVSIFRVLLNIAVPVVLLFWWSTPTALVVVVVVLYASIVTDVIDGQLARAYGTTSPEGHFVDSVTSASIPISIYISAGVATYLWGDVPYGLVTVAFILGTWGITAHSRDEVLAKESASRPAAPAVQRAPASPPPGPSGGDRSNLTALIPGIVVVIRSPHFLLLRFAGAVALALVLSEVNLIISLFLGVELALSARTEIRNAVRVYRQKLITRGLDRSKAG